MHVSQRPPGQSILEGPSSPSPNPAKRLVAKILGPANQAGYLFVARKVEIQAAGAPVAGVGRYLCSKSTGAVTSCTRKYFASAGYLRATASYIA
jgi:hypothetical protein